jgi:hypothetical protein
VKSIGGRQGENGFWQLMQMGFCPSIRIVQPMVLFLKIEFKACDIDQLSRTDSLGCVLDIINLK